jgi:uncharacterized protein
VPTDVRIALTGNGHLSGTLELTGTAGCVVYVHGFGSESTGAKARALQAACARRGYSYAAFDFRGHGRSSGVMRDLRASGLQSDLEAVRDFLASQGVTKLFLVGSSMGGFASSWFALRHPELVPAVVLMAPAFNFLQRRWDGLTEEQRRAWRETGTIRFRNQWLDVELEYGLIEERSAFDPGVLADRWRTPALIFHGMRDESVRWEDTLELVRQTPFTGIELRLLGDGDHRLLAYAEEMAEEACRFFARRMGE